MELLPNTNFFLTIQNCINNCFYTAELFDLTLINILWNEKNNDYEIILTTSLPLSFVTLISKTSGRGLEWFVAFPYFPTISGGGFA